MFQVEVVLLCKERRGTGWKDLALVGFLISARFASHPNDDDEIFGIFMGY